MPTSTRTTRGSATPAINLALNDNHERERVFGLFRQFGYLEAELNPPIADCCVRPPSMIHIDKEGNVIGSFDHDGNAGACAYLAQKLQP